MDQDLFVITSVINTGSRGWSYTDVRSVFSTEQRFEQTLRSIESIRTYSKNSLIMLIECSDIDDTMAQIFREKVDYFIQTYDMTDVREACIKSNKKGYGEVKKLGVACEFIRTNNIKFKRLFKLSGRYFLNDNFDAENYSTTEFTFMKYAANAGSTVLYSVPDCRYDVYCAKLNECIHFYEHTFGQGLETLIPNMCVPAKYIKTLGVSGYVAVKNDSGGSDFYTA